MSDQVELFGITIDAIDMPRAVARLSEWIDSSEDRCRYVVTPNTDHSVMYQKSESLRDAYADASMVLADGMPVVWASRLLRRPLPQRVPGSDLAPAVFEAATEKKPLKVYLLGAMPGVADRAAKNIERHWPAVQVVGTYSPPLGFEHDATENHAILRRIAEARPDILIVGLGAPKQELWVHRHHADIKAKVALCIGATIDFLAGAKSRAPKWMQRTGLEWMHRMLSDPRRLLKRYLHDAWVFPQLVWRQWRGQRKLA
jgi:N-acetylglucosaminyldiphosphoundecaprenol N-acetyl-beta-D-mannosaminyltransferase